MLSDYLRIRTTTEYVRPLLLSSLVSFFSVSPTSLAFLSSSFSFRSFSSMPTDQEWSRPVACTYTHTNIYNTHMRLFLLSLFSLTSLFSPFQSCQTIRSGAHLSHIHIHTYYNTHETPPTPHILFSLPSLLVFLLFSLRFIHIHQSGKGQNSRTYTYIYLLLQYT